MPESSFYDSEIEKKVSQQIVEAGWKRGDILQHSKIPSHKGYSFQADFVLLYELYPLAIVEVKAFHSNQLSTGLEQASHYAKQVGLPISLVTNGKQCISKTILSQEVKTWDNFPTPKELLKGLGKNFDLKDARLTTALPSTRHIRLPQALAIKENLDALASGKKSNLTVMPQGSGSTLVIGQIIHKILASDNCKRVIYISDRLIHLDQIYQYLSEYDELKLNLSRDTEFDSNQRIYFVTANRLNKLKNKIFESASDRKQVLLTHHIQLNEKLKDLAAQSSNTQILSFLTNSPKSKIIDLSSDEQEYSSSRRRADEDVEVVAPENHRVLTIGDIAEDISRGIILKKNDMQWWDLEDIDVTSIEKPALLLSGRNILANGNIDYASAVKVVDLREIESATLEKYLVKAGDILIPFTSRNLDKIAIAPQDTAHPLLFSNTLIRIRIDPQKSDPLLVFSFIRSDIGKSLLKQNASSFLLDDFRLSAKSVSEATIFLPPLSDQESTGIDVENEFSYLTSAIRQIKDEILPQLQELNQIEKSQITSEEELSEVSFELHKIAFNLAPAPLSERVLNEYPMPVALAYRRFYDSRFNVYEKTQRLRDLFEASFIFIYNLMLADWLRNLNVTDNGARRAYQTFALSRKNDFLKHIIKNAKANRGSDLFIPEIANSSLTGLFDNLKDLRNHLSHSATETKSKQEKILSDNEPIILDMLEGLDFLRDYRLVRVPLSYRKNGQDVYRMEVYKGVAPQLEEKPIEEDVQSEDLKMAEHDHLILLRNDGKILDLHPLYQLVDNEKTQYQPHICFFKQRSEVRQGDDRNAEKRIVLKGESISSSETISLRGADEFEKMLEKIQGTKPE